MKKNIINSLFILLINIIIVNGQNNLDGYLYLQNNYSYYKSLCEVRNNHRYLSILDKILKRTTADTGNVIDFLVDICSFGNDYPQMRLNSYQGDCENSWLINDEIIIINLIYFFGCKNDIVRQNAKIKVYQLANREMLKRNTELMNKILINDDYLDCLILPLFNLSGDEKNKIIKGNVPLHVRGKLGDTTAIKKIIKEFKDNTDDVKRKAELAFEIAYMGTDECAKALVKEIGSKLYVSNNVCVRSFKYEIFKDLGLIYNDNEIFTKEITKIRLLGEKRYGKENVQKYYIYFKNWAKTTLDIDIDVDTNVVIVEYYNKIKKTPIIIPPLK